MKTSKNNVILADCNEAELADFKRGLEESCGLSFSMITNVSNRSHGSALKKIRRYASYFTFPLSLVRRRGEFGVIVGWQQFHAINYAFFSRLLGLKKRNKLIVANFTYKEKPGLLGRLYGRYMRYAVGSKYIDGIHVPSFSYAKETAAFFGLPDEKMIVACFGTPDRVEEWGKMKCDYSNFALAIGRSNRDFDFLARVWSRPEIKATGYKIIILADTWEPAVDLSANPAVIHISDITGPASYPFFGGCDFSVVPLKDENMCSGDTVLLNSMMMSKPVVITAPSTLAEMYIKDGDNGLYIPKDEEAAAAVLLKLITDRKYLAEMGARGRASYVDSFSRRTMGRKIGESIAAL